MITQPELNPQLTFDQQQAIDLAQKRLTNIQNESFAANKLLSEMRVDTERITKERDYQQSLLSDLVLKNSQITEKYDVVYEKLTNAVNTLKETQQKADSITTMHEAKTIALIDRENTLHANETEYVKKQQDLHNSTIEHQHDKALFEEKKIKMKHIIEMM